MQTNYRTIIGNILLLDLDNTLTDTRRWFADFILDATAELAATLNVPTSLVNSLFAEVAQATTLHEYAFAVEAISCSLRIQRSLSYKTIQAASEQFWCRFASAHEKIELYEGVHKTLDAMRAEFRDLKIVILTDSPEWVALERLSITGLLPLIDGVVAIRTEDPRLRQRGYRDCVKVARQRIETAQEKVNKQHLLLNMSIPAAFAKPSSAGIELIARRLGVATGRMVICGDKDTKEGQAAAHWRQRQQLDGIPQGSIDFVRANYGNHDLHHSRYTDLAKHIHSLSSSAVKETQPVPVSSSIDRFDQLPGVLREILSTGNRKHAVA